MDDPEKLKLRDLLAHFTAKQLWGATGALLGLVGAAFALGFWLSGQKSALELATERTKFEAEKSSLAQQRYSKDDALRSAKAEADASATESKVRIQALEQQLGAGRKPVDDLTRERSWLRLKAEFLEHFLRYELSRSSGPEEVQRTKGLFVGFVHRLWKAQEDKAVQLGMQLEPDQRVGVERPIVVGPIVRKSATPAPNRIRVIKTVTFPDGSSYEVPYEIAAEVHRRG